MPDHIITAQELPASEVLVQRCECVEARGFAMLCACEVTCTVSRVSVYVYICYVHVEWEGTDVDDAHIGVGECRGGGQQRKERVGEP